MSSSDLDAAAAAVDLAEEVVRTGARSLATAGSIDDHQVLAYDLAHAAAAVGPARALLEYGSRGDAEAAITCAFVADMVAELSARLVGRASQWGVASDVLAPAEAFLVAHRDPDVLAALVGEEGPRHLDSDFELVQDTFRRFTEDKIGPVAEHVHRTNADIPEDIIAGLAELGAFGLSIPEEYGGFAQGDASDYLGMVVATEELSRGSLGVGGSLITRPEILARALVTGGTEEQKQHWLPKLASGEAMVEVAVTEPDVGSDVAGIKVAATPTAGGWRVSGVKTWCTFGGAGRCAHAAGPDRP